jgi:ClpP class serine protease
VDTVLAKMADGRIFLGKQAIEAGLVDGVRTLDGLIAELNQRAQVAAVRQILTERSVACLKSKS